MSKGNAVTAAKARIITLEGEIKSKDNIITAQRTVLAKLKRDAIDNAGETTARLNALTNVIDEYNREMVELETKLEGAERAAKKANGEATAYANLLKWVLCFESAVLVVGLAIWGIL